MATKTKNRFDPTGYGLGTLASSPDDPGPLFAESTKSEVRNPKQNTDASVSSFDIRDSNFPPLPRAVDIAAGDSGRRRQRILQFLTNFGETTIHEFCAACTSGQVVTHPHQVSGRFTDLAREGLITTIGERAHPVSGAACNVYAITESGRDELARMKSPAGFSHRRLTDAQPPGHA